MEIAVLGGGHGCYAAAAELSEKGHTVRFWRRDNQALQPLIQSRCITVVDFNGERDIIIAKPTTSLEEAVTGADIIVIPLPATTHEALSKDLAPLLVDGQAVYLPPGTFGSYVFYRAMRDAENNADVSFAETGTLPYLARKHGPTRVVISGYATRLPTGVFPAINSDYALNRLKEIYPIEHCKDALSGALMNAGPIIHPPLILMNAGPLEHFDAWDIHNEGTQPSIRRVTTALDGERIALREALGYGAPHFPLADHYNKEGEGDEWMYGRSAHEKLTDSGDWREDIDLERHRYMLEDTRLGLSLLVSVGRWAGVSTPVAEGLLNVASGVTGRDLYREGRTLENLGLVGLNREQMYTLLQTGQF
ncbi:NAD/NADP-dependent octopine/nopaline dehydrogenase family protein [Parahaliea mediterranea]|uniref:NAD/NADP-dependent octopine/nopaline dehydrogenase family protein n=1 Tax=Parahaliea mediterranea TaxID=651086 RepID=UPI000E2E42D3|nr:NAD/NADP-dependent octopine/nopaline dehydrogenase family protein [Parahaliea mediterranea]